MMCNSRFFSEAAIVANYALQAKDPIGFGIKHSIRRLKNRRKALCDRKGLEFNEEVFNKYSVFYEKLATEMIKTFIKCSKEFK